MIINKIFNILLSQKIKQILLPITVSICITSCNEPIPGSGDILLSKIADKTNYEVPMLIEKNTDKSVILNDEPIEFKDGLYELSTAGFYTMIIGKNDPINFVMLDPERGETEWGLNRWIPAQTNDIENFNSSIDFIYPKNIVEGIDIPVVLKAGNFNIQNPNYVTCYTSNNKFRIKKGFGSTLARPNNKNTIEITITDKNYDLPVKPIKTEAHILSGTINTHTEFAENSLVRVQSDLIISSGASLTFAAGTVVLINQGVNITSNGSLNFNGNNNNPILVTCSENNKLFGGFICETENSSIEANHTFFTRFAYHSSEEYQYGHANHQALFKIKKTQATFDNCYFTDTPGQVFYPQESTVEINNCLIQRAKTSGQLNWSTITITDSYFSDFPENSDEYKNDDNDALYINACDAHISNSIFMHAKDDGIDSGGNDGGNVTINGCAIEACFHEGIALSSKNPAIKNHHITNCIVSNCQQGIELGFSSQNHEVTIENCTIKNNYIGVRYGDNYTWSMVEGKITVKSSVVDNNTKNTWNMIRQNWDSKPLKLIIEQ